MRRLPKLNKFVQSLKGAIKKFIYSIDVLRKSYVAVVRYLGGGSKLDNADDPIIATLQTGSGIHYLAHFNCKEICEELPFSLVMAPCVYQFHGKAFECRRPGVYRFSKPQRENAQRIILDQENPVESALFLALIAYRGNFDDSCPFNMLERFSRTRFLSLTCGPLVDFAVELMKGKGIHCRPVLTHTLDPANSYNNGHALLEVWYPALRRFIVVDMDKKCYFTEGGKFLNVFELTQKIYNRDPFEIVQATTIAMVDWSGFEEHNPNFNYQFIEYAVYGAENGLESCLKRICQFPILSDGGNHYACLWKAELEIKIRRINPLLILMEPLEFYEKFYSFLDK